MDLNDIRTSIRLRDILTSIAESAIRRLRPDERIGKVFSYDNSTRSAKILFAGESIDNLVTVHVGDHMIPSLTMAETYNQLGFAAPSDIVRVAFGAGQYYICDYISGSPRSPKADGTGTGIITNPHANPSFETVSSSTYGNGNATSVTERAVPTNWSYFWGTADASYASDTDTWNGEAGRSLKMTFANLSSNQRAQTTVFEVKPGSIVTMKVKVKSTGPDLEIGVLSSDKFNFDFFDGNSLTKWDNSGVVAIPTDGYWREYTYSTTIQADRTKAKISLRGNSDAAGSTGDIWFDATEITVDESGVLNGNNIIAANDLKGKQLYVNERRFYEMPVLGEAHTLMGAASNSPADGVYREIYKSASLSVPSGTRAILVSAWGTGQATAACANTWKTETSLDAAAWVEQSSSRQNNTGMSNFTFHMSTTFMINVPVGTTTFQVRITNANDALSSSAVRMTPGGYKVTYLG